MRWLDTVFRHSEDYGLTTPVSGGAVGSHEEPERTYLAETDTDGALKALQACLVHLSYRPRPTRRRAV
jgi:hypothetical protein